MYLWRHCAGCWTHGESPEDTSLPGRCSSLSFIWKCLSLTLICERFSFFLDRLWCWEFFLFNTFQHCLPVCIISDEKSLIIFLVLFLYVFLFLPTGLKISFLLLVFISLAMVSHYIFCISFAWGLLRVFLIIKLVFSSDLQFQSLVLLHSQCFLLLGLQLCEHETVWYCPTDPCHFFQSLFFPFILQIEYFYWFFFKFTCFFFTFLCCC